MINQLSDTFKPNVAKSFKGEVIFSIENIFDGVLNLFLLAYHRNLINEKWANDLFNSTQVEDFNNKKKPLELGINCKSIVFTHKQDQFLFKREDDERRIILYQEISHIKHIVHDKVEIPLEPILFFLKTFDFKKISYMDDLGLNHSLVIKIRDYNTQKEIVSWNNEMLFLTELESIRDLSKVKN